MSSLTAWRPLPRVPCPAGPRRHLRCPGRRPSGSPASRRPPPGSARRLAWRTARHGPGWSAPQWSRPGAALRVGWHGGNDRGRAVVAIALAGLLAALATWSWSARAVPGCARPAVGVVLVLVPVLQAAGTNVPRDLRDLRVRGHVGGPGPDAGRAPSRPALVTVVVADLSVLVVGTTLVAARRPSATRSTPGSARTRRGRQGSAYGSPRIWPASSSPGRGPRAPTSPRSTPVLALDENAGLTYLWAASRPAPHGPTGSPARTAGILELACRHGDVPDTRRSVLSRPGRPGVAHATGRLRLRVPAGLPASRPCPRGHIGIVWSCWCRTTG